MVILVVFGGMMLVLSGFYLANSWQRYREWKWATFLVVISLAVTAWGAWGLVHQKQQAKTETASSSSQTTTSASISSTNALSTSGSVSQSTKENSILGQLQKAYSKMGSVSFDESTKTYEITPTSDDETEALQAVLDDPSQADTIGWPKLTKSLKSTSKQLKEALGAGYSLTLLKPNSSDAMYTVKNGQETYTAVNN